MNILIESLLSLFLIWTIFSALTFFCLVAHATYVLFKVMLDILNGYIDY